MDIDFLLRAKRLLADRQPAVLDHRLLVAALAAERAASPIARALTAPGSGRPSGSARTRDPLVEVILAGPDWRRAVDQQRGSFSPSVAAGRDHAA